MKYLAGFFVGVLVMALLFVDSGVSFTTLDDWKNCRKQGRTVWTSHELIELGRHHMATGFWAGVEAASKRQDQKEPL